MIEMLAVRLVGNLDLVRRKAISIHLDDRIVQF